MSSNHTEKTTEPDVSRLTDDQARAIVVSGMPSELLERPLSSRPSPRVGQSKRRRLEHPARAEWSKIPEVVKARRYHDILFATCIVVFVGTACTTFILAVLTRETWQIWSSVLFAGLIVEISLFVLAYNSSIRLNRDYEAYLSHYIDKAIKQDQAKRRQEIARRQTAPEGAKTSIPERWLSDPDLQNLLLVNRTQLNVYQDIATKDAKAASRNSRFAMIIGFLILLVGSAIAIRTPNSTSKIVVGALASLGSLLSGYIGQTFLKAQAQAMKQLNYYFRQPLVASYLLSAERIALKLEDANSTKQALLDVIKNVLLVASRAEEHDSTSSDPQRRRSRRTSDPAPTEQSET